MKYSPSLAHRGRPREFDPDTALAAALRVFWRNGYEGASLSELTEAMGIGKPSLYACFGNKEALFRKALDLYEREKLAYMRSAMDAPSARGVAEKLLYGAVETYAGDDEQQGWLGSMGISASTPEADSIRADLAARRASSDLAIAERFEQARKDGDLNDGIDPACLAQCLMTQLQGLVVKARTGVPREELTKIVGTFLDMWPSR
ncbi:TetR/AcrR family transcriptional regulator [Novosphingobium sp. 9]|uniref:TetR/AcrR family transcriptional regulator n=1 Tax=Novosphingobium sp. 9 TaxID=2025349 RepID=UPI0021B55233|nr:TetR/AcrR family transcriptional regulator [Novosphingobium sp. 9]